MRIFRRIMLGGGIDIDTLPDTQKLYYKASAKVTPKSNSLDAPVIANKWDATTGEGVIVCGRDIKVINNNAFSGDSVLTSITIPGSVTSIVTTAFENCSSLISIIVSEGNSTYDSRENCNAIIKTATNELVIGCGSTIIPNNVTSIGYYAFYHCTSLTSITIPDSVTSIGYAAFHSCTSLASITIPDSVTSIGGYTFYGCSSLTSVIIPDSVTKIASTTFGNCTSLTSVTIPDSVGVIESAAFENCTSLTSVTIPEGVANIYGSAFSGCTGLTSINIPKSVTSISYDAFKGCSGRLTINSKIIEIDYTYNNKPVKVWLQYSKFTELILNDNIEKIGSNAFSNYSSLTSVTIGNSVTEIRSNAFSDCLSMQYYDFSAHESVPTLSNTNAFSNIPSTCKIIVPDNLYDEWIAATNWSTYADYIIKKSDWDASQTTE